MFNIIYTMYAVHCYDAVRLTPAHCSGSGSVYAALFMLVRVYFLFCAASFCICILLHSWVAFECAVQRRPFEASLDGRRQSLCRTMFILAIACILCMLPTGSGVFSLFILLNSCMAIIWAVITLICFVGIKCIAYEMCFAGCCCYCWYGPWKCIYLPMDETAEIVAESTR